ncbi:MAG: hypothetical protein DELT_03125 [Desulfovibrio sp.]
MPPQPHCVHAYLFAFAVFAHELFGNDGIRAARARKARRLGKAAEFNRARLCPVNFINAVRYVFIRNKMLVRTVEKNQRARFVGPVHPDLKLRFRHCRARRVVGRAQIHHVHLFPGKRGHKAVFRRGGDVGDLREFAGLPVKFTRAARHHVGIHIYGIHRVCHADFAARRKQFLDVARIAFAAVRHKNFIHADLHPARRIVVLADGRAQELVTLLRTITHKCFLVRHFLCRRVDRLQYRGRKRPCHVANAEADNFFIGVRFRILAYPVRNLRK